jgi:hypothetical protein
MSDIKTIKCEAINTYRNKKNGKKYPTKEEYLKENKEEDMVVDLTVKVPGFDVINKTQ